MNPRVKFATPNKNYQISITFTNDEEGIFDCSSLLDFGVFQELKDEDYFNSLAVAGGTIAWPHGQDICPDTVYLESKKN